MIWKHPTSRWRHWSRLVPKRANLVLVLSKKYKWPEDYFSIWCWGNSWKILTTNFYSAHIFSQLFLLSICFLVCFESMSKKSIKSEIMWFVLFSYIVVHSLRAVAMFFNILLEIKRNQRFTAHISWLSYFLWLWTDG